MRTAKDIFNIKRVLSLVVVFAGCMMFEGVSIPVGLLLFGAWALFEIFVLQIFD